MDNCSNQLDKLDLVDENFSFLPIIFQHCHYNNISIFFSIHNGISPKSLFSEPSFRIYFFRTRIK